MWNPFRKRLSHQKYTILRRAIQYGKSLNAGGMPITKYTSDDLKELCHEMEGKSAGQLREVHEKWIGY